MFKQQSPVNQHNHFDTDRVKRDDSTSRRKMPSLGIRVMSSQVNDNSENKMHAYKKSEIYNNEKTKVNTQNIEHLSRVNSIRGIQVMSSKNSSKQKQLTTSHSGSHQKYSPQIKSQTQISQFISYDYAKQNETQRLYAQISQQTNLSKIYEQTFKVALEKNNTKHELQLECLSSILNENEERINNLIQTINRLMQKSDNKQKIIERLQQRIESLSKYNQQCYEYSLRRCENVEVIAQMINHEVDENKIDQIQIENKIHNMERIMTNIFGTQKRSFKTHKKQVDHELNSIKQVMSVIKTTILQSFIENQQNISQYNNYQQKHFNVQPSINKQFNNKQSANQILHEKLKLLQNSISFMEKEKQSLITVYRTNEEKTKEVIWQLSNLLNKQQRDIEKKAQQYEELTRYNKQIENRLIEFKLNESRLKIQIDSQIRSMNNSTVKEEYEMLLNENNIIRERYQNVFKHKQYLEQINSKNSLILLENAKQINQLQKNNMLLRDQNRQLLGLEQQQYKEKEIVIKNNQESQRQIEEMRKNIEDLKYTNKNIKQQLSSKIKEGQIQIQSIKRQHHLLLVQIQQIKRSDKYLWQNELQKQKIQINKLGKTLSLKIIAQQQWKREKQRLTEDYSKLKQAYNDIQMRHLQIKKQFQQQELYSAHLQNQNDKLESKLSQCTLAFKEQSQLFKQNIEKLKQQNVSLIKKYEGLTIKQKNTSDQMTKNKTTNYSSNHLSKPRQTSLADHRTNHFIQCDNQKLIRLEKALKFNGFKVPVVCQIDETGYLKHHQSGTYIYDANQNLFEFSPHELQQAKLSSLIKINE